MKILVFDFEVFMYDTLLGVYNVNNNTYFQTWDKAKIREYFNQNRDAIWVGHNNADYDNLILQAIMKGKDPFIVSREIVSKAKRHYLNMKLNYYDICSLHPSSLKAIEASVGKNISESSVDFNLDRPLTSDEKSKTEQYNRDDLDQTFANLKLVKSEFQLRLDLIREFKLPIDALHYTQAQLAEAALQAEPIHDIENKPVKPVLYPQMQIKNQEVIDYYLSEGFRTSRKPVFMICGLPHQMGAGGIHAGRKKYHADWAFYFDVSGYYNLVMINYNLFSRAMPESSRQTYIDMYNAQLKLKKTDPVKRAVYKTILLAVFGAQMHETSKFYDPWNGALVPIVGQLFLVDLLEKLEGKVELIQSNTDGIIAKPLENIKDEEILSVVNEWQARTGFVLKMDKIYDIYQRDVNCYMYRDDKGNIHAIGARVKYYDGWDNPLLKNCFNSKDPIIFNYCIVEYFMNKKKPEETIVKYAKEFRLFQYICKPDTYDYLSFEAKGEKTQLQKVNRCFASKEAGMIYKNKKNKHDRYPNLPEKVFVWNESLDGLDFKKIDYIYYAKQAYKLISEFE